MLALLPNIKMKNETKKNIAYQIAFRVITILTPLITSPILSRALGAEKLGTYSATLTFVNYFVLFSMLGVENYGNRSIAAVQNDKKERRNTFWSIYYVQFVSCVVSIGAYAAALHYVDSVRVSICILQGIWLISSLLNVNWYFFGTEQFQLVVIRNIVVKILAVLAIVLFIRKPEDLQLYVIIMAADVAISNLVLWPFLVKDLRFALPNWDSMQKHVIPILILFIPVLAVSVFHVMDKTMIDVLSTEQELGYYYSADKLANIPLGVITAVSTVMLPRISSIYSKGERGEIKGVLKKSFELTVFLTCSIAAGIAAIAKEFVPFFFGAGFEPCIPLVYWFSFVLFAKAVGDFIRMQYLVPTHRDKLYTTAICVGAAINLILNYFLIPTYGALGAVCATLAAEAGVSIFQAFFVKDEVPLARFLAVYSPYFVFSAIMFAVVRITAKYLFLPTWLKLLCLIGVGGIIYLMCCLPYWRKNTDSTFHNISLIKKTF